MIALVTPLDAVFDGLSFGIKYLVRSFGLKVKPGGRKGFVTPCTMREKPWSYHLKEGHPTIMQIQKYFLSSVWWVYTILNKMIVNFTVVNRALNCIWRKYWDFQSVETFDFYFDKIFLSGCVFAFNLHFCPGLPDGCSFCTMKILARCVVCFYAKKS